MSTATAALAPVTNIPVTAQGVPLVKLTFERVGDSYFGTAEIGRLKFKVLVPLAEIREEVKKFLAAQPPTIAGDPTILANLKRVHETVAQGRAKRRLGTAIKTRFGGRVKPYEVAGPAGFGVRIARQAANKMRRTTIMGEVGDYYIGYDAEVGILKFIKKVGKGIGKGVKAVGKGIGKGTVAVAKGIGKGAKAVGKGTVAVTKAVVKAPLTSALLTAVPGGQAASNIIAAARKGSPGAKNAIAAVKVEAKKGNPVAVKSAAVLNQAALAPPPKEGPPVGLILGGLAAGAGLLMLARK